jgi:hypothetical protein
MFCCYGFQNFHKTFVNIPVATGITGIILHFMFHIRCIYIHKLLYFVPFCFLLQSAGFSFMFLITVSGLLAETVTRLSPYYCNIFMFAYWFVCVCVYVYVCVCVCVCAIRLSFRSLALCTFSIANMHKLYHFSKCIYFSPK